MADSEDDRRSSNRDRRIVRWTIIPLALEVDDIEQERIARLAHRALTDFELQGSVT